MKTEYWFDIIFGVLLLPGMMFLFPVGEWAQWHPGYVLTYIGWLYLVYFLCRKALGPQFLLGWRGHATALGVLFIIGAITFLMTLTEVQIPETVEPGHGMAPHVRAMWILLLAVISVGLPVGMYARQVSLLKAFQQEEQTLNAAQAALELKRNEAMAADLDIQLKSGYKTVNVPLSAVQYLESRNNYVCVHLDHLDDVVSQIPLKNVLEMMPPGQFVRIHRSYAVPVWRIEKQSATEVKLMGIEEPLPVGRAYKDQLKNNG